MKMKSSNAGLGLLIPVVMLFGPAPGSGEIGRDAPVLETTEQTCSFAIRARNRLSFDVWVELYDSTVRLDSWAVPVLLRNDKQLKIQNHRLARGQTMDRRYTASGDCSTRRRWTFHVRIGGRDNVKLVYRTTEGSGSQDRIVDLGDSSKWGL